MEEPIPVLKDEEQELPVPTAWRRTFVHVVDAFAIGDLTLKQGVADVMSISDQDAAGFRWSIESYGGQLTNLSEDTWKSSICLWMGGHWEVLVDLFTDLEGLSDLVLFARVYEDEQSYTFEITSIHVP